MNPNKFPRFMPFMFNVYKDEECKEFNYSVVKISRWIMLRHSSSWMSDSMLPEGKCLVPDVDWALETHKFQSEKEALDFIKNWYINN